MIDTKELKQRFKSSIKRGTGEAHLLMQNNPATNFSAEIIKASLTALSYDPQCEGSRAPSGPDIRKFAIQALKQTKWPSDYLDLLVSNFKKGDSKLLTEIARNCKNEIDTHHIVWGIVNIYRANKTNTCKKPLEAIYAKLNCSSHREDIVRILKDNNVLSKQIRNEMRYDCDEKIRSLV